MEKFPIAKIDLERRTENYDTLPTPQVAAIALELGAVAIEFSRVDRVPRYDETSRESDVEHSYMLALVVSELAERLFPGVLDSGLVSQFAIVHDLIELLTGDVATFHHTADQMLAKQETEHAALAKLMERLPPHTRELLYTYEQQQVPEARFVKAVDKLLPVVVDVLGPGQKVMNEDYNVHTSAELQASHTQLHGRIAQSFGIEFPQVTDAHALLCELFELEFEATLPQS
ncbi:MAG: HD domain-containing protein [Candidatus Microsaccharimonas sp.]